jgi:hypothetical protein
MATPSRSSHEDTIMKMATMALAAALALSVSPAFAQAGEGDANFAASGGSLGYSGGYGGFSGAYGGYGIYLPYAQGYAWEPEVRVQRWATEPRYRARVYRRYYPY